MRPLKDLSLDEKARLIHQLLPDEIMRFLSHLECFALSIVNNADQTRQNWREGTPSTMGADQWIETAKLVANTIEEQRYQLNAHASYFAMTLFTGTVAQLTMIYLPLYCSICAYRFSYAVKFFFELQPATGMPFMDTN